MYFAGILLTLRSLVVLVQASEARKVQEETIVNYEPPYVQVLAEKYGEFPTALLVVVCGVTFLFVVIMLPLVVYEYIVRPFLKNSDDPYDPSEGVDNTPRLSAQETFKDK